jgi:hypothetical protein
LRWGVHIAWILERQASAKASHIGAAFTLLNAQRHALSMSPTLKATISLARNPVP